MTWSYTLSNTPSVKDQVRLLIGDTDTSDQQLADEEIAFLLANEGDYIRAAATACETIAAKYSRQTDYTLGKDVQESRDQLQKHYLDLAARLRVKASRSNIIPYAGGISISDKTVNEDNTDIEQPFFQRDMQIEPGTAPAQQDEWELSNEGGLGG